MKENYGRIITTPESIVRKHRAQVLRLEKNQSGPILGKRPAKIPWYQKIDRKFVVDTACAGMLVVIILYMFIWIGIPFLRMLRWN